MEGRYGTTFVAVLVSVFLSFHSSVWTNALCSGENEFCVPQAHCQHGEGNQPGINSAQLHIGEKYGCENEGEVCCEQPSITTGAYSKDFTAKPVANGRQQRSITQPPDERGSKFLANRTEFPWVVGIFEKRVIGDMQKNIFICAGSVLMNGTILTSAECFRNRNIKAMTVQFDRWNLTDEEEFRKVEEVITVVPHPGYKPSSKQHNIALLFVDRNVTSSVIPVCNAERGQRNDPYQSCYSVGWQDDPLKELLKLPVNATNLEECQNYIRKQTNLPKFELSAKDVCGTTGAQYPCPLIPGSAFVCGKDNQFCLVGIFPRWVGNCSDGVQLAGGYDVFVDVREYSEWINENGQQS